MSVCECVVVCMSLSVWCCDGVCGSGVVYACAACGHLVVCVCVFACVCVACVCVCERGRCIRVYVYVCV